MRTVVVVVVVVGLGLMGMLTLIAVSLAMVVVVDSSSVYRTRSQVQVALHLVEVEWDCSIGTVRLTGDGVAAAARIDELAKGMSTSNGVDEWMRSRRVGVLGCHCQHGRVTACRACI